ncbi:MAG: DNA repair exonuclease [Pyrinomonadaceae bacterium]|nr:DNA repair exonuclease [Pyrinomonadaceae bacterium]
MKFLHIADVHLGCRRYNLEERTKDFFRAWQDVIIKHALPNELDFMLIAGDFFNSRKVDPQTMNHAIIGLQLLKDAGIPVLAIEGNHDQHDAISNFSWLRSLSQWGYLKLLEPVQDPAGGFRLVPWDEEERTGSYIDIAGARIFGSHWYGTSANVAIPVLAESIRLASSEERFHILMLHTDVEGQLNRPLPALSIAKLKALRSLIQYVALGHTHKRFELEGWALNPGSLEACSIDEYREERGIYLVEIGRDQQAQTCYIRDFVQRPFARLSFDVSGVVDAAAVQEGVIEKVRREVKEHTDESESPAPIIEISLRGHLGFKNSLLELNRMRDEACELTGALHVMVRNQSVPVEYAVAVGLDVNASRHERERRIIEDLIARDTRFRERARDMTELVVEAKRLALSDEPPTMILDLIAQKLELTERTEGDAARDETLDTPEITVPTTTALNAIERNAIAEV